MISRRGWLAGASIALFAILALLSSSLTVGAPAQQIDPTGQQQTVDAAVQHLFQATMTAQAILAPTQTVDAAFNQAQTATAGFNATVNAAFEQAMTATAAVGINTALIDAKTVFEALPQERAKDGGFVIGNPNAPITIVEFGDFACSHCQEYHPTITQFIEDYVVPGKAKFEYRIFPTAGGQLSEFTGQLLECAEDQKAGNFWKGYDLMFDYAFSGRYTQGVGRLLANDEDLNYSDLLTCASTATQVKTDESFGSNSGVTGTPAVMIRYNTSGATEGQAQFIIYKGQTYNQGGVPYSVLAAVTEAAQQ